MIMWFLVNADATRSTTNILLPEFFQPKGLVHLPQAGEPTCFQLTLRDASDNIVNGSGVIGFWVEGSTGSPLESFQIVTNVAGHGLRKLCFTPPNVEHLTLHLEIDEIEVSGFPFEIDSYPGTSRKVLYKNCTLENQILHHYLRGDWDWEGLSSKFTPLVYNLP